MLSEINCAIRVQDVSKYYNIFESPKDRLFHSLGMMPQSKFKTLRHYKVLVLMF